MCRLDIRNNDGYIQQKERYTQNTTKYILIHSRQLLFPKDILRSIFPLTYFHGGFA